MAKEVMKKYGVGKEVTVDKFLKGKRRDDFLKEVQGRQAPLKRLEEGKEYKCYAKFECNECK